MICDYKNSYIVNQDPQKYGGKQDDYLRRREEAIQNGIALVNTAIAEKKDLKALFFQVLDSFAKARNQAAVAHATREAGVFGHKRMDMPNDINYTGLVHPYLEFNTRMIRLIQEKLHGKIPLKGESFEKKHVFRDEYKGRKGSFEIELLTGEDLVKRQWTQSIHSDMEKVAAKIDRTEVLTVEDTSFNLTEEEKRQMNLLNGRMLQMKKEFPAVYIHGKMHHVLKGLANDFPSPKKIFVNGQFDHFEGDSANLKSIYILCKARVEINGKMYALSEYLTWTYQDFKTDPVERISRSKILLIHQDRFLIDDMMQECAREFEKALQETDANLRDHIALIRYLQAHAMVFARGSAAIGEWYEEMLYRVKHFSFKHKNHTVGDLEAIIAPTLNAFMQVYDSTIEVSPEKKQC